MPSWPEGQATWYADLGLGFSFAHNMNLTDDGGQAEFDLGTPIGSFAIGRYLNESWRAEVEFGYRDNDLENFFWPTRNDEIQFDHNDGVRAQSLMFNVVREFQLGALEPYFGAGMGPAEIRLRMSRGRIPGVEPVPPEAIVDEKATALAWQLIGGFAIPLTERTDLGFDYRYWQAGGIDVQAEDGTDLSVKHATHSASVHLRYLFSGDRPPRRNYPAQTVGRWYLAGSFGGAVAMDSEVSGSSQNLDAFSLGPNITLTVGRRMTHHWRLELEAAWRENRVEVIDFGDPIGQFSADGEVSATSLMVNAAYGFRPEKGIRPYLGAGLGAAHTRFEVTTRDAVYLDDDDGAAAIQLIAGLDITLTERLDFTSDFRTWFTYPIQLDRPDGSPFETWHWVHSVNLGLRYSL